jgi:hypothetical protein
MSGVVMLESTRHQAAISDGSFITRTVVDFTVGRG